MVWEFLKFRYFGQIWQPKLAKIHIFAIFDIFLGKFSHKRGTFGGSTTLGKLKFCIYHCSMMLWRSDVGILKILIFWPIFRGPKFNFWWFLSIFDIFGSLDPQKWAKNQNFQNSYIASSKHHRTMVHTKFQLPKYCRLPKSGPFMQKLA